MKTSLESYQSSPEYVAATKNWKEKGYLGVTAQDHKAIGSTPEKELLENPDKTLGELMGNKEALEYVVGTQKNILENEHVQHHNPESWKKYNDDLKQNLEVSIKYLKSIGKLPPDFGSS